MKAHGRMIHPIAGLAFVVILGLGATPGQAQERESPPMRSTPRASRPSVLPSTPPPSPPPSTPAPSSPAPQTPATGPAPEHGGGGHGRRHYHHGYGYGYRYHPYYGYWGYGLYWPYHRFYRGYWAYGYPYYPWGFTWYPSYVGDTRVGAIDLEIRPRKADVYVDGEYIGRSGKFDGYPGYLWLSEGTHQLVFYYEGKQTVARDVRVGYGPVRRLRLTLVDGASVPPEELFEPVREQRVAQRRPVEPRDEPVARDREKPAASVALDLRESPGRFRLEIEPADATVYLDGRFLGRGDELSRLHDGMMVEPGEHYVEVQRPGYETKRVDFSVAAGDETALTIDLDDVETPVESGSDRPPSGG